jgi:hypothetical protein
MTNSITSLSAPWIDALQQMIPLAQNVGAHHAAAQLVQLCALGACDDLNVLFFGEFNRGKSTLINALLGRTVLPARLIPTTGHVTSVRFGEVEEVHLLRSAQSTEIHPLAALDAVATLRADGSGRDDIEEIAVTVNHPLLQRRLVLLDTPGMNEDAARHARTESAILRADLIVFVLDAQTLLGEYERSLAIDWLQKSWGKPILPVINFMERVRPQERDDVRHRMANWCASHLEAWFAPAWLEVDALRALKYATGAGAAPVDDFAHLRALLFEMDEVAPGMRARLQRHSRGAALRTVLRGLHAQNAPILAKLQTDAERATAQRAAARRTLEARLNLLHADMTLLRQSAPDEVSELLGAALRELLAHFAGKSKADLDRSGAQWYRKHLRRTVQAVESHLISQLETLCDAEIGAIPSITLTARMSFERQIYVASLAKKGASGGAIASGAVAGALVGSFIPVIGTAWGAAIGGGMTAMLGRSEADPVAAYRTVASSAWGIDAETLQRLLQEEITAVETTLTARIEQRLGAGRPRQATPSELKQRTALAQAISACEQGL